MPEFGGGSGLTRLPGAKYTAHRNGLATYNETWKGTLTGSVSFQQGDPNDRYANVVLLSAVITHNGEGCEGVSIDLHYEGRDDQIYNFDIASETTIDSHVSLEPIEAHPDFTDETIAGTPQNPKHGAQFDSQGKFLFFAYKDPDNPSIANEFAGVRSYQMPQLSVSQSRIDEEWPDLDLLGKIVETDTEFPQLPGNRTYLLTSIRSRNIANQYFETQKTILSSGPKGWNPAIYGAGEEE